MVKMLVCFFCYERGDGVEAVAYYFSEDMLRFDVCTKHKKTVEDADFATHEIDDPFSDI